MDYCDRNGNGQGHGNGNGYGHSNGNGNGHGHGHSIGNCKSNRNGNGNGNGQGNGQNNSQHGNPSAQNPPRVVRRVRGAAESAWDDLRKRDRGADALGALKSKYPARYKMLVEQYYRSVQGGNKK